jgi:GNAT superfamily N-acetyltransferase
MVDMNPTPGAADAPRPATMADVDAVTALVNRAYEVESFFVIGNRITREAVVELLGTGTIFVVGGSDALAACIYVSVNAGRGYFGLLAVEPARQRHGLGRRLITLAETFVGERGAAVMDISVVNVRTDLIETYTKLGYRAHGTAPYEHRPVLQPVHFVLMEKLLPA